MYIYIYIYMYPLFYTKTERRNYINRAINELHDYFEWIQIICVIEIIWWKFLSKK